MTKAELRKEFLEKRKSLTPSELAECSAAIADRFFSMVDLSGVKVLHSFLPIVKFHEVDTTLILHRIWDGYPQIKTAVPRVDSASDELQTLLFSRQTELAESAWGIHEPAHDETVPADEIDLVLVPLLCFDRSGHRVGYGKGYYDRLLSKCRADCKKVGLSFFDPVDRIDDVHAGDVTLDYCVTPTRLYDL